MIRTHTATTLRSLIATPRTTPTTTTPSNPAPTPASATLANARLSFGASSVLKQRAMPEEEPIQTRTGRLGDDRAVPEEDEKMRKGDPLQVRSGRLGDDRMVPEEDEKMRKGDPQAKLNRVGYQPPWLTQLILSRSIR